MQINATGGMRGMNTEMLSPSLLLAITEDSLPPNVSLNSPLNKSPHPHSDKRTISLLNCKDPEKRGRVPSAQQRKSDSNNKHVTYLEEEIRRTRASKHTSDYPTAVS